MTEQGRGHELTPVRDMARNTANRAQAEPPHPGNTRPPHANGSVHSSKISKRRPMNHITLAPDNTGYARPSAA